MPEPGRRGLLKAGAAAAALQVLPAAAAGPTPEVRGTWLTTTANRALATPADTEATMAALADIGLNTVYVECWKNGYTQYPSEVLERTIGHRQRPGAALQDPSDRAGAPARDLLAETLGAARRHGLRHVAWFEYGFMAAHGATMNTLRRTKPQWLSRDRSGGEVAPNGFVWMNPLHPEARQFLLDLTLEAVRRYDVDGVQFDDRIVWPYVTMGYDTHTRQVYAAEHGGRQPPDDPRDAGWMRWRADKLDALAADFCAALRAARPGLMVSLSPAVYPWSWEHYLLAWPRWARWPEARRWREFVPQAYRTSYPAFERTWLEQIEALKAAGAYRRQELVAGIRLNGEGPESDWETLRRSIELVRAQGNGGHALWFSRGVLETHAAALKAFYGGPVPSPRFAAAPGR